MSEDCKFGSCDRVATVFYISLKGLKYWYCVEHYDEMADTYRETAKEVDVENDDFINQMVKLNGW